MQNVLRLPVVKAKTGVKYLHKAALQFDIAVYFEANGHGTILFSDAFIEMLETMHNHYQQLESESGKGDRLKMVCISNLLSLHKMINPSVGDAISGMLLVDITLRMKKWKINTWANLYKDLPSRQIKVVVPDRRLIITNETEERVLEPAALQIAIDKCITDLVQTGGLMYYACNKSDDEADNIHDDGSEEVASEKFNKLYDSIRCFVRPSGTEDVVRIYLEASNSRVVSVLLEQLARKTKAVMESIQRD